MDITPLQIMKLINMDINTSCLQYYHVREVSKLFFCENLMNFNEAILYEASLNLHTHTWIFSRRSIASVNGKQHLSKVVFSTLVGFLL